LATNWRRRDTDRFYSNLSACSSRVLRNTRLVKIGRRAIIIIKVGVFFWSGLVNKLKFCE